MPFLISPLLLSSRNSGVLYPIGWTIRWRFNPAFSKASLMAAIAFRHTSGPQKQLTPIMSAPRTNGNGLVAWIEPRGMSRRVNSVTWRVILTKQIYMRDPNRFFGMWDCLFWTPGFGIFLKKSKNCPLPIFVIEFCITGVNGQIWLFYAEKWEKKLVLCLSLPPGNFAGKRVLKLVERFSCHHKAVWRSYTSRPSDPDVKFLLVKFGHAQKAKFLFAFSPIFFRFSCLIFFLLLGI